MQVEMLKSKIHRAAVTGASLHYEGSLSPNLSASASRNCALRMVESIAHLSGIKPNIQEKSCDVEFGTTGVQLSLGFG